MAREVDLETFAAAWVAGAVVLDVREPEEYRAAHVPGAHLAPLSTPDAALPRVPKGRTVYVICASGNRSRWAADRLVAVGVDAISVAGGTRGWAGTGRPVVTGSAPGVV
ncbi:rhodanese-like domain-containing protein [Streptomyces sp. TRM75563]|uniref:rhodanese-like domain-containing protein n=1 Tax=Streptomyces sp. TRM75563 TaxID=2817418 RepID=UPI001F6051A0|nr:rhodanese-like domain-containing protein [Streptomyces sp. TRM75563]MCI4045956.1 rhodanese-like domain-containing protein [Streptomyces sp. TRM75563]